MKKTSTKLTSSRMLLILAGIMAVSALSAFIAAANFSGEWTLNETKSALGDGPRFGISTKVKITQDANMITFERTRDRQGTPMTSTDKVTLDGKETDNEGFNGSVRKEVATWSADGKTLTVTSTQTFNDTPFKTVDAMSMDGGSLVIATTRDGFQGGEATTVKAVYDKK